MDSYKDLIWKDVFSVPDRLLDFLDCMEKRSIQYDGQASAKNQIYQENPRRFSKFFIVQCLKTQVLSIEAYHISDHKEEHEEEDHQFLSLDLNLDSVNHPVELFENFKS